MKKILSVGVIFAGFPMLAFARVTGADAFTILGTITNILSWIIPILITVAVIYFIIGVIKYTVTSDEEAKKKAKGMIIYGIIGLFVIVSFWGLVSIVSRTFDVGTDIGTGVVPCTPTPKNDC